ncbi:MAG: sulfite exporter TauE/SafE family protein [Spirochaetales bacterium]
MTILLLVIGLVLGFVLGFVGSLTGIGGGFLLMPILLLVFPEASVESLALVSLCVVFFNSFSGSVLALTKARVRLRTGMAYGLVSLPTVWLGTQTQALVQASVFRLLLGALLFAGAILLFFQAAPAPRETQPPALLWLTGTLLSLGIGFVSGFFALGGGFLFLPLLVYVLRYRIDQATATTQFIVGVGSLLALALHLGRAELAVAPMLLAGLVAGVLVGAPVGSAASTRWNAQAVLRLLALLLVLAGLKFVTGF